ncbi:MAG: hypothetical protein SV775_10380 [Thermodesulfobacteriota bacterium]|nr:hypothetical protein [Thermodesulfobacteriota bacterium]
MRITHKVQEKFRHGLVINYLLDRLSSIGIGVRPFYIAREGFLDSDSVNVTAKISPCTAGFLSEKEIKALARHPEVGHPETELLWR